MKVSPNSSLALLVTIVLAGLSGCSSAIKSSNAYIARLNNRGPVVLSSDNPFLAGNLLLSREMENSPEVKGFVEHRGAPQAIEVTRESFGPLMMFFYYPESREVFNFEMSDSAWIISGPTTPDKEKLTALSQLTRNVAGEPKLLETKKSVTPAIVEPSEPEIRPTKVSPSAASASQQAMSLKDDPADIAAKIDALLGSDARHMAETTPRGDVVHHVVFPGESLSIIARWYTYDKLNAPRIARINGLSDPNRLSIGDSVVIPGYLVKNKNRLTADGVEMLKNIAKSRDGAR